MEKSITLQKIVKYDIGRCIKDRNIIRIDVIMMEKTKDNAHFSTISKLSSTVKTLDSKKYHGKKRIAIDQESIFIIERIEFQVSIANIPQNNTPKRIKINILFFVIGI